MEGIKYKILIVDDEVEITNTLQHYLNAHNYEVMTAFDGEAAQMLLEKDRFHLVILDIVLPGISGIEVAHILKNKHPGTKIVITTGYPAHGEILTKGKSVDWVFLKPVSLEALQKKISELLDPNTPPSDQIAVGQQVKARTILIKAKLLLIEPDITLSDSIRMHLNLLSHRGELYEVAIAHSAEEIKEKREQFQPEIIVVNNTMLSLLTEEKISKDRLVTYTAENSYHFDPQELKRITEEIGMVCLNQGFFEVKWSLVDL